jgi:gliding motility associated protien GldN
MTMKRNILLLALVLLGMCAATAQEGYNPLSLRPVHTSDVMYKKTITRALDLREKQNLPLFSRNKELTALLIEGVVKGTIKAYENDSLQKQLTVDEFSTKLLSPNAAGLSSDTNDLYLEYGDDWKTIVANMKNEKYMARDLYQLEIKEEVIFEKQRSRLQYDIQIITVYIPADHPMNAKGIQLPLASFSYKELVENLFKDNPKAIWFNTQNDQQHKNLADAFDLRLFSSYIIKVSNANDSYLTDIYNDQKKGIMASSWAAQELMEYEHNLWEF